MSILPKLLLYNDWYAGTHTKWHCRWHEIVGVVEDVHDT